MKKKRNKLEQRKWMGILPKELTKRTRKEAE